MSTIRIEERGPAVLIGLDRSDKRNALNEEMVDELHDALGRYRDNPCVLIFHSTTPGTFVSGADIAELLERRADDAFRWINGRLFEQIEAHRWPTIAAIDGAALGGGCELALACDIRIATRKARFGQPELALGIIAGAGGNWRIPAIAGLSVARRMLYLGEILDADSALAVDLIDEVCDEDRLIPRAEELAVAVADRSWRALELTKLALRSQLNHTTEFDLAAQAFMFESEDKHQRMTAFLERRGKRSGERLHDA